jgi:hypothetical protein
VLNTIFSYRINKSIFFNWDHSFFIGYHHFSFLSLSAKGKELVALLDLSPGSRATAVNSLSKSGSLKAENTIPFFTNLSQNNKRSFSSFAARIAI